MGKQVVIGYDENGQPIYGTRLERPQPGGYVPRPQPNFQRNPTQDRPVPVGTYRSPTQVRPVPTDTRRGKAVVFPDGSVGVASRPRSMDDGPVGVSVEPKGNTPSFDKVYPGYYQRPGAQKKDDALFTLADGSRVVATDQAGRQVAQPAPAASPQPSQDRQLFTLADGTPVVATNGPGGEPVQNGYEPPRYDPKATVGLSKIYGPEDDQSAKNDGYVPLGPPVDKNGKPKHETKKQLEERQAKNDLAAQLAMDAGKLPFKMDLGKLRPPKPPETEEQKRKKWIGPDGLGEWWTRTRGEKKDGAEFGIDIEPWEASTLRYELSLEMQAAELQFPGAAAKAQVGKATNQGDPQIDGEGGAAGHNGLNEWAYRGGSMIGNAGVTIVQVLRSWNLYEGQ
jgi:hypothetical protein